MFLTVQPVKSHELDGLSLSSSLDLNGNPVSEKMARGPLVVAPAIAVHDRAAPLADRPKVHCLRCCAVCSRHASIEAILI